MCASKAGSADPPRAGRRSTASSRVPSSRRTRMTSGSPVCAGEAGATGGAEVRNGCPPSGTSKGRTAMGRRRAYSKRMAGALELTPLASAAIASGAEARGDAALDDGVARELGVGLRPVARVVQAAALVTRHRALDDELRHGRDVAELEEIARDEILPVVLGDLFLQERDAPLGPAQAFVGPDDADVVPHEA